MGPLLKHNKDFDPRYGEAVDLCDGIRRITAPNPGPFTFHGTNTYLMGGGQQVVVVDPGPEDDAHLAAIQEAAQGQTISAIAVTHTHVDHSPGARKLKRLTGAPIIGCGPHAAARPLGAGEVNLMDASADLSHRPDLQMKEGDEFDAGGGTLVAIESPGHTQNHLCFALKGTEHLLSADHVMAWSTSIVAPPDGNMRAYMTSLDKLSSRGETHYLPGHGSDIQNASGYVASLKDHRLQREAAILDQLGPNPKTIPELVRAIYKDVPEALHGAAGLSVFAHLEDLVERNRALAVPRLRLDASYTLV